MSTVPRRKAFTGNWLLATGNCLGNMGNLRHGLPLWYKNQQEPML